MERKKTKRTIPKVVELVNILASYLDSEMDYDESKLMTPLSKEIGSHVDTVRNKLTEGFVLRDVLIDFKPTFEDGKLTRIEKIRRQEVSMERVLNVLLQLSQDIAKLKEDINEIKKNTQCKKRE